MIESDWTLLDQYVNDDLEPNRETIMVLQAELTEGLPEKKD